MITARREFLIENKITFPALRISDEIVWNLKLIFTAKRWLRINILLYVQRHVPESFSRRIRLQILDFFVSSRLDIMSNAMTNFTPSEVCEIFLREFSKAGSTHSALISYLLLRPFVKKS